MPENHDGRITPRIGAQSADGLCVWNGTRWKPLADGYDGPTSGVPVIGSVSADGGHVWNGARWASQREAPIPWESVREVRSPAAPGPPRGWLAAAIAVVVVLAGGVAIVLGVRHDGSTSAPATVSPASTAAAARETPTPSPPVIAGVYGLAFENFLTSYNVAANQGKTAKSTAALEASFGAQSQAVSEFAQTLGQIPFPASTSDDVNALLRAIAAFKADCDEFSTTLYGGSVDTYTHDREQFAAAVNVLARDLGLPGDFAFGATGTS